MFIAAALAVLVALGLAYAARGHRGRARAFPPVVELAHTGTLPRLGNKIATLTAKAPTTHPAGPQTAVAKAPALPFATMPAPRAAATADTSTADVSAGTQPPSIFETTTGPYAAPLVQGSRIRLPDSDTEDLPIRFRSAHPNAQPIAEAGDHATEIQVAAPDGRIHLGSATAVTFGPPAD